jgi:DNA primase
VQAPDLGIAEVLEHYGADLARVRETGWRPMRCPFHKDNRASASVNLAKGGFNCHGCGVKGDAISLIKSQEGLDYQGAIQFAEEILGRSCGGVRRPARKTAAEQRSQWRDTLFG